MISRIFAVLQGQRAGCRMRLFMQSHYEAPPPAQAGHGEVSAMCFLEIEESGSLFMDSGYVELNEEGYPRKIDLCYTDIDRNTIFQQFRLVEQPV